MERINIFYYGGELTNSERGEIKAQLGYHLGDAPSDSTLCCCISNEEKGIACNLRVHSASGHIFIHRESHTLNQLMEYVYDSMKQSFKHWHRDHQQFAKSHPLTNNPCKSVGHNAIDCPLNNFAKMAWNLK